MKSDEIRKLFRDNDYEITEHTDTFGKIRVIAEPLNPNGLKFETGLFYIRKEAFNSLLDLAIGSLNNLKP